MEELQSLGGDDGLRSAGIAIYLLFQLLDSIGKISKSGKSCSYMDTALSELKTDTSRGEAMMADSENWDSKEEIIHDQ